MVESTPPQTIILLPVHTALCEVRAEGEPIVATVGPVAERVRRVLEEGPVLERGERPHRQQPLDLAARDVRRRPDDPMRGSQAAQPVEAPRKVASEPRGEGHDREEHRDRQGHDDDELLELRPEIRQRAPGSGERFLGDVAGLRADQRQPGQRRPEGAAALDHRLATAADRPARGREPGQEREQLPDDRPPEQDPDEGRHVGDLLLQSAERELTPDLGHDRPWPPLRVQTSPYHEGRNKRVSGEARFGRRAVKSAVSRG